MCFFSEIDSMRAPQAVWRRAVGGKWLGWGYAATILNFNHYIIYSADGEYAHLLLINSYLFSSSLKSSIHLLIQILLYVLLISCATRASYYAIVFMVSGGNNTSTLQNHMFVWRSFYEYTWNNMKFYHAVIINRCCPVIKVPISAQHIRTSEIYFNWGILKTPVMIMLNKRNVCKLNKKCFMKHHAVVYWIYQWTSGKPDKYCLCFFVFVCFMLHLSSMSELKFMSLPGHHVTFIFMKKASIIFSFFSYYTLSANIFFIPYKVMSLNTDDGKTFHRDTVMSGFYN